MKSIRSSYVVRTAARPGYTYQLAETNTPPVYKISTKLGSVVYFIRCPDGCIKIGYTTNLSNRIYGLGVTWTDILAIAPGGRDDERELHDRFAEHLARGAEYFDPAPALVEHINALRDSMNIPSVSGWTRTTLPPLA